MLEFRGEFGRVRLGGGPQGSGVYWVDDGSFWNEFDPSLPNSSSNQNFDISVRNRKIAYTLMGMVRVSIDFQLKKVDVRWNLRSVSLDALDAVSDYLYDVCHGFSVQLDYCIDGWCSEFFMNASLATERTQLLMGFRRVPLIDSYFIKPMVPDRGANTTRLIQFGVRMFEKTRGNLDHPEFRQLMPYLLVYKPYEVDDQLVLANAGHLSANARIYGGDWARTASGGLYDKETPGVYFSQRASEVYSGVTDNDAPRLDHIRALVNRPNDEPMWASYQRFLFRGYLNGGAPVLVCLADLTPDIDIPFLSA